MANKGCITVEHTVWCCTAWRAQLEGALPFKAESTIGHPYGCVSFVQHSGDKRSAIRVARDAGWLNTKEFGWLCAPCAEAWRRWTREIAVPKRD